MGFRFFIARRNGTLAMCSLPVKLDFAHLHGGAFLDVEVHLHRGRRNGLNLGFDSGKLVSVLRTGCP